MATFMLLSLLYSVACVLSAGPVAINVSAVTYVLDASLPAHEYLKIPCQEMKEAAVNAFQIMLDMIPKAMQPAAYKLAYEFWESGGVTEPYHSEIEYLSNCSGLTIDQLITVNIVYDLSAFCTSIVARTKDGKILHARNQDFPTVLRNDTVNLLYVDANNNTLYEATTFFGYVGVPTGIKFDAFSITDDAREDKYGLQNWIDIGKTYFPSGWLIRECLLYDKTFDECVHRLSSVEIQAPIYYIIAGIDGSNQGAVITRNQTQVNGPNNSKQVWFLNDTKLYENWYIVETNYDWWKPADDSRRENAVKMLDSVGQDNISFETLYNILSTPPVLAKDTVYTIQMAPSNKTYYNATIRFDTK
eukprot:1003258_1